MTNTASLIPFISTPTLKYPNSSSETPKIFMDTRNRSIRVLMLPWLAHGHISPFLQLSKTLAKRNFLSYICSSAVNLNSIKKSLSPKDSVSIKLVELPIPTADALPPHYHTTNGLPPHLLPSLKLAFDRARPAFATLLKTLKPDLVLYDFLPPWAPEEASFLNIPAVLLFTTGAASTSLVLHHCYKSPSEYPFPEIYYTEKEFEAFSRMVNSIGSASGSLVGVVESVNRSSNVVLIKTVKMLEEKYIDHLLGLTRKVFIPVGPLIQDDDTENGRNDIIQWLDEKSPRSTVFASFGSEHFLSEDEIEAIAMGLEKSGLNFIWVLRFPKSDEKIEIEKKLPHTFLQSVVGRGMVVEGWAPERKILRHASIGGFLSHCGWSWVMEGIYMGVPIIAVPMHWDQPLNARLVEGAGVGEEVPRSGEGKLVAEEVGRVVRKVVAEESGADVRRKVAEMGGEMRGRGEEEIDGVVGELVRLCEKSEAKNVDRENSIKCLNLMVGNDTREGLC